MKQQSSIITQLEEVLKKQNKKGETYDSLNRADDLYNKLLAEGIIKKRGYTLRGIDDFHLRQIKLNTPSLERIRTLENNYS